MLKALAEVSTEVQVEGSEDDSDQDAPEPREQERETILHLQDELALHECPDLLLEANRVDGLLGSAGALLLADGNPEVFMLLRFHLQRGLVFRHLGIQSLRELGLLERSFEGLRTVGGVGFRPSLLILALELVGAAGDIVRRGLPGAGYETQALEVSPSIRGGTEVHLLAFVNDQHLVKLLVDVLGCLIGETKVVVL